MNSRQATVTIKECCSKRCFGNEGHHAGCCSLDGRNFIMGPVAEPRAFLEAVRRKFQDESLRFEDVFMDFDEGRLFSSQPAWQNPDHYPCLRVNPESQRKYCLFYNPMLRACSIYSIRPQICRNYNCSYLKQQLGLPE